MNTKLHAVADAHGRPIRLLMTAGQVSDYTGAAMCDDLPKADWLLADKGYDAAWFRDALKDKGEDLFDGVEIGAGGGQARMSFRASARLGEPRLSRMTMSPRESVRTSTFLTEADFRRAWNAI